MNKWVGKNKNKAVIRLFHSALRRLDDESVAKSVCPFCGEGIFLVRRDDTTMELMPHDSCKLCGQHVYYMDIVELRKKLP